MNAAMIGTARNPGAGRLDRLAAGVTGDTEDKDEELAVFGIDVAGFKTDEDCEGMGRSANVRQTK